MAARLNHARILIYSHDSFGLGHLRRCRSIAHSLVGRYKGVSILILSGSPIIGSFDFKARVDFVRIPGIIKLKDGDYTSLGLHIDTEETLVMRESIIYHTAKTFKPDIFIVDKEPTGLKGEVVSTLKMLQKTGTLNILGLRDVMDDSVLLKQEWLRKNVHTVLENLYDEIWVYGPPQMGNPIDGLNMPQCVMDKIQFTGFLDREMPSLDNWVAPVNVEEAYILVTNGGGGDGLELIDWVLRAYEQDPGIPFKAVLVTGPFMQSSDQYNFHIRAEALDKIEIIDFDSHLECLMQRSIGVVAMGGYNTFCEILTLQKRAIIVPRSVPRKEQLIRASKAEKLGLCTTLNPDSEKNALVMASALKNLPKQKLRSNSAYRELLQGHSIISQRVSKHLGVDSDSEH